MDKEEEKERQRAIKATRHIGRNATDYYDNPNWKIRLFRGVYWVYSIAFIAGLPFEEWMTIIEVQLVRYTPLSIGSIYSIIDVIEWLIVIPVITVGLGLMIILEFKFSKTKCAIWLEK